MDVPVSPRGLVIDDLARSRILRTSSFPSPIATNSADGADEEIAASRLVNGSGWKRNTIAKKRRELVYALRAEEDDLTQDEFDKRYELAIKDCLPKDDDATILHFLSRRFDTDELDFKCFHLLIRTTLCCQESRYGDEGLVCENTQAPVLVFAIARKHFGLIESVCNAAREMPWLKRLVAAAIAAKDSTSQNALHAAIMLQPMNFDIIDLLIEHSSERSFRLKRSPNGNTPLHDFVQFAPNRFAFPSLRCPVTDCALCDPALVTSEAEYAARFVKTLKNLINRFPDALAITDNIGQTPYVTHIRSRKPMGPAWEGLEYGLQDSDSVNASYAQGGSAADNDEPAATLATRSGEAVVAGTATTTIPPDDRQSKKSSGVDLSRETKKRSDPVRNNGRMMKGAAGVTHVDPQWIDSRFVASEVAKLLLEQCSSQKTFDDALKCIFGNRKLYTFPLMPPAQNVGIDFKAQDALYDGVEKDHEFLVLNSILAYVEVTLVPPQDVQETLASSLGGAMPGPEIRDMDLRYKTHEAQQEKNANRLKDLLAWLRDTKGVRRILKLIVKDLQEHQCGDDTIEECLRDWDIRYLDWNKHNLSIEAIRKGGAESLIELYLTWNGQASCLVGWLDPEYGLQAQLSKLHRIHIDVSSSIESAARCKAYLKDFETRLKRRFPSLEFKIPRNLQIGKNRDERSNRRSTANGADDDQSQHKWIQAVAQFVEKVDGIVGLRRKGGKSRDKPLTQNPVIKVALIDDGVNPSQIRPKGKMVLRDGWPPPDLRKHGDVGTFYNSADGHGTIMANLIQFVCPYVDLYVARLEKAPTAFDSAAHMAAEAVAWAKSQDVDIISMSWTIKEREENKTGAQNLKNEIESAGGQGIRLFCASDDVGMYNHAVALPASSQTKLLKKIGSCNVNGSKSDFVNEANVDYLFPGEQLQEVLQGWKGTDKGSSASTALASGLAALLLWCFEWSGHDRKELTNERMYALFDKLKAGTDNAGGAAALVDVTELLNDASTADNPIQTLVERVREKIPEKLRGFHNKADTNGEIKAMHQRTPSFFPTTV